MSLFRRTFLLDVYVQLDRVIAAHTRVTAQLARLGDNPTQAQRDHALFLENDRIAQRKRFDELLEEFSHLP